MTTERLCRDCGEPITEDEAPTVVDEPGLCDRCSAESIRSPNATADRRGRGARWIAVAVAVGVAGAVAAVIGVMITRKQGGTDQAWAEDDYAYEVDDLDDFGGFCEECDDKVWIHYCPECHRSDD